MAASVDEEASQEVGSSNASTVITGVASAHCFQAACSEVVGQGDALWPGA